MYTVDCLTTNLNVLEDIPLTSEGIIIVQSSKKLAGLGVLSRFSDDSDDVC